MYLTNVLALAALAILPVSASPMEESLVVRGACKGGMVWNGWKGGCQCENKNCDYDSHKNKCHYPPKPKPVCPYGQQAYCAKSASEYCEYDSDNSYCYDDGSSYTFCCAKKDFPHKVKEVCPPSHPSCPSGQHYDYPSKKCMCPSGMIWRNNKCCHQPLPKPHCPYGQKPYCAKDKDNYCEYDDKNDYCDDDGHNTCFCSSPPKVKDYCNKYWHN